MADSTVEVKPRFEEKKGIKIAIWVFTVVVFLLVGAMGNPNFPKPEVAPAFTKALPAVNAIINSLCFLVLILSLVMIKKKNVNLHMRLNTFAMLLSVLFLTSYVVYHFTNKGTDYEGDYGFIYYPILIAHIVLSGISLPFILFSYYRAFIGDVEKHKKLVRFAYPMWLIVAATGPMVFLMLAPYYK